MVQSVSKSAVSPKKRRSRFVRADAYPKFVLGRPKHNILGAVGRFDYLANGQLSRLIPLSLNYVRNHVQDLFHGGYLHRIQLPSATFGPPLDIQCLDTRGLRYLRQIGRAPAGRYNLSEIQGREPWLLPHTLSCNDLLILCHLLERQDEQTELVRFMTEREMKRSPGVTWLDGRKVLVIPDGWAHLRRAWPHRTDPVNYYIAFELDRGTIQQKAFRRKVRALLAWIDDPNGYTAQFGVSGLTIAVVTTKSDKRVDEMKKWTEQELTLRGLTQYSDIFLFAHLDPSSLASRSFGFDLMWAQPLSDRCTALLEHPG